LTNSISELTNQFTNLSASKKDREEVEAKNKKKTERKVYLENQSALESEKQKAIQLKGQSEIDKIDLEISRLDSDIDSEEKHLQEIITTKAKAKDNLVVQSQDIQKRLNEAKSKVNKVPDLPVKETKQKNS
jgi:hypothetical protein